MPIYKSDQDLTTIAASLFPDGPTTDTAAVLHARRKWVDSVRFLRDRKEGSHWLLDRHVLPRATIVTPRSWSAFAVLQRQIKRSES
jgi:hypothetical protein